MKKNHIQASCQTDAKSGYILFFERKLGFICMENTDLTSTPQLLNKND